MYKLYLLNSFILLCSLSIFGMLNAAESDQTKNSEATKQNVPSKKEDVKPPKTTNPVDSNNAEPDAKIKEEIELPYLGLDFGLNMEAFKIFQKGTTWRASGGAGLFIGKKITIRGVSPDVEPSFVVRYFSADVAPNFNHKSYVGSEEFFLVGFRQNTIPSKLFKLYFGVDTGLMRQTLYEDLGDSTGPKIIGKGGAFFLTIDPTFCMQNDLEFFGRITMGVSTKQRLMGLGLGASLLI